MIIGYIVATFTSILILTDVNVHPTFTSALAELPKILIIIGIVSIFIGRKSFGTSHKKFGMLAMGLFLMGILLIIIGGSISVSEDASPYQDLESPTYEDTIGHMMNEIYISFSGLFMITAGIAVLVYHLENKPGKIILFLALIATLIITIYSVLVLNKMMNEYLDLVGEETSGELVEEGRYVFSLMGKGMEFREKIDTIGHYHLFANLFFLIGFIIPYRRIKKGELIPQQKADRTMDISDQGPEYTKHTCLKRSEPARSALWAIGMVLIALLILAGALGGIERGIIELSKEKTLSPDEETASGKFIEEEIYGEIREGNWSIYNNVTLKDRVILLKGDLMIEAGGKLIFDNVSLIMGCEEEGQYTIEVRMGGELLANNSTITTIDITSRVGDGYSWEKTYGLSYGFMVFGKMELKNCNISYANGIWVLNDTVLIDGCGIYNGKQYGIYSSGSSLHINASTITTQSGNSLHCVGSSSVITNNKISSNENAIFLTDSSDTLILNNTLIKIEHSGIEITRCSNISIIDNTITDNTKGIDISSSDEVIIDNNVIRSNSVGVKLWLSDNVSIINNGITENSEGIDCRETNCLIFNNLITHNDNGISCSESDPYIKGNDISNNYHEGIINYVDYLNVGLSGIYCTQSSPIIENNRLNLNNCAITCIESDPVVSNTSISGSSE